jgi:cysteine-rich repeat protein
LTCWSGFCVVPPPSICGDAITQAPEECDQGGFNANDGICKADCTLQVCGDTFVGPGEECDDGNQDDDDACTSVCQLPWCGNGIVEGNEECDDGDTDDRDSCPSTCMNATCGDGFLHDLDGGTEACDDGNAVGTDGCSNSCALQPLCGDGLSAPGELCFLPPIGYTVLGGPVDVRVVDIARPADPMDPSNGALDIVVVVDDHDGDDSGTQSGIRVLRGEGNGLFEMFGRTSTGHDDAASGAVGDFDGDGKIDVAVAHPDGNVTVARTANPAAAVNFFNSNIDFVQRGSPAIINDPLIDGGASLVITEPVALTSGDFDEDGRADIGIANRTPFGNGRFYHSVLFGSPTPPEFTQVGIVAANADFDATDGDVRSIAFGRFNDVDEPAFVIAENTTGRLRFMYSSPIQGNQGAESGGSFTFSGTVFPTDVATGDLDGDNTDDVSVSSWDQSTCDWSFSITACSSPNGLFEQVWAAFGTGNAAPAVSGATSALAGKAPVSTAMGDFNGDGWLDIVYANQWGDNLHVVTQQSGILLQSIEVPVDGSRPTSVQTGDVNGDGVDDIIVGQEATNLVTVLLSNP